MTEPSLPAPSALPHQRTGCELFHGTLDQAGDAENQPPVGHYFASDGVHEGWLDVPAGAVFRLELFKWTGRWSRMTDSFPDEESQPLRYRGSSGYYFWRVESAQGGGTYKLWIKRP